MHEANTLDDFIELFINYLLVECGLSRNTILSYSHDLQIFTTFLISKNISDFDRVRPDTITSFIISEKKTWTFHQLHYPHDGGCPYVVQISSLRR